MRSRRDPGAGRARRGRRFRVGSSRAHLRCVEGDRDLIVVAVGPHERDLAVAGQRRDPVDGREDARDRPVRMAEPLGKKMNLGEPGCQGNQKDRLMRAQHPGCQ